METNTTAAMGAASDAPNLYDAHTKVCRAKDLNEVLFMAGEGQSDRRLASAITTQCDVIDELLREVGDIIIAALTPKGGHA